MACVLKKLDSMEPWAPDAIITEIVLGATSS